MSVKLVNELRLDTTDPRGQELWLKQMKIFLNLDESSDPWARHLDKRVVVETADGRSITATLIGADDHRLTFSDFDGPVPAGFARSAATRAQAPSPATPSRRSNPPRDPPRPRRSPPPASCRSPATLVGRVVVLDIAFAAAGTGASFEKVTGPFLARLGERLAAWVDHHDHNAPRPLPRRPEVHPLHQGGARRLPRDGHPRARGAGRRTSTPSSAHNDFDGLYAAAKWILGGVEPYPGADDDARAIDTRTGDPFAPGASASTGRCASTAATTPSWPRVVDWLVGRCADPQVNGEIEAAAARYDAIEQRTRDVAGDRYTVSGGRGLVRHHRPQAPGGRQDRAAAPRAAARQGLGAHRLDQNVTLAAAFDSGLDFLAMLGVAGGMPTRVSVPRSREAEVRAALARRGLLPT
jgi:hypothetical protein